MKETKKQKQTRLIIRHGNDLRTVFGISTDPVTLCKQLRRIENALSRLAVDYCNGYLSLETMDAKSEKIMKKVDEILNYKEQSIHVFFNRDPRGYALKIKDTYMRDYDVNLHRDMGGYGIIAPKITGE